MVKSIVVGASLVFCACIVDSSNYSNENNSSNLVTCAKVNGEYPCCDDDLDVCRHEYKDRLGIYLNYPALSNGACTGGGSGAYQCATFAQGLWTKFNPLDGNGRPIPVFTKRWLVAARALQCASTEEGLFIFRNGSSEPPRETDILVYLNNGQDEPGNCNALVSDNDLEVLYAHPGHVSVVSKVVKNNGLVTRLGLIEENLIISGNNRELCDQNLEDSIMRTIDVAYANNVYTVDSGAGMSRYRIIGWIRHNLAGIYADEGWHEDDDDGVLDGHSVSQSFRSAYNLWDQNFLGWARDNSGTPFVHTRNEHILQDFVTPGGIGRALVYNPNSRTALLVRDGFYNIYLEMESATGLPLDEEHQGTCLSMQNFENGYLCWSGFVVSWFRNGILPPSGVESEPEPAPPSNDSGSNSEPPDADTNEPASENQDQPAECYSDDWLPCYTGSFGTQNIGLCQGGRTLCSNGHWQWNECVGEITPASENCLDGLDNDCDGLSDCLDASCAGSAGCPSDLGGSEELEITGEEDEEEQDQANCDADGDGYRAISCGGSDCNDANASIHPGAPESCNYRDDDCDGTTDEGVRNRCNGCGPEPDERCGDLMDNDCDGVVDEVDVCPLPDFDRDGTLDLSDNCPDTYNQSQSDIDGDNVGDACDPRDDRVFPPEVCDGVDNNNDGLADNGYECLLNSWNDCPTECGSSGRKHCASNCTWSLCFPPIETCWNGIDDDCDGYESEDCGTIAGVWCYGSNLISNSSFENSLNNWTLEVQGNTQAEMLQDCSTSQDGECALRVVIGRMGALENVALSTTLNLVSGNEYQIRLYTRKRDENAGDAPQILISSRDGVANVGVWSQCAVSDNWSQCAIRFRARDSVSGYRLLILLGGISGEVLLDDARVVGCP